MYVATVYVAIATVRTRQFQVYAAFVFIM